MSWALRSGGGGGPGAGVVGAPAAARADVEQATLWPKGDPPAVVVGLGLIEGEQRGAGGVGDVGIGADGVFGDDRVAGAGDGGVVHVELAIGRVVRMERKPEQSLLAADARAADDDGVDVEEGRGQEHAVLQDADSSLLFDYEHARVVARGVENADRADQAADDAGGGEGRLSLGDPGGNRQARGGEQHRGLLLHEQLPFSIKCPAALGGQNAEIISRTTTVLPGTSPGA